jgi:hypothetical protein
VRSKLWIVSFAFDDLPTLPVDLVKAIVKDASCKVQALVFRGAVERLRNLCKGRPIKIPRSRCVAYMELNFIKGLGVNLCHSPRFSSQVPNVVLDDIK